MPVVNFCLSNTLLYLTAAGTEFNIVVTGIALASSAANYNNTTTTIPNEVTGTWYSRRAIEWTSITNNTTSTSNSTEIRYTNVTGSPMIAVVCLVGFSVTDLSTTNTNEYKLLAYHVLDVPMTVSEGGDIVFPAGSITLSIS